MGRLALKLSKKSQFAVTPTIPETIWQTYMSAELPPDFVWYQATWRAHHPDWNYHLLDDAELRAQVAEHRPALLAIFDGYKHPICRVDLARYVLLATHGGVYADLDFECLKPIAPLIYSQSFLIGLEPATHLALAAARERGFTRLLSPALIASRPGHPFWDCVFALIVEACDAVDPLDATGPYLLTRALERYRDPETIALAQAGLLHPLDKFECKSGAAFGLETWMHKTQRAFGVHHWAGTWWQGNPNPQLGSAPMRIFEAGVLQSTQPHSLSSALTEQPLVCALMVTARRYALAMVAIASFQAQDYPNCELVIVEDDSDPRLEQAVAALNDPRVRLIKCAPGEFTLGELRNQAISAARGEWVCQWDDDDLYDPARLRLQMAAIQAANADGCFLLRWTIWWPQQRRFASSVERLWEGSLLARKALLEPYPSLKRGEDTPVTEAFFKRARVVGLDAPRLYVYVVHGNNTFDPAHFDAHWQDAHQRFAGLKARRVKQELCKRLDLEAYLDALATIGAEGEAQTVRVNFYSRSADHTGVALAARSSALALQAVNVSIAPVALRSSAPNQMDLMPVKSQAPGTPVGIAHVNPDHLLNALHLEQQCGNFGHLTERHCIGIWAWESPNTFRREHVPAFELFDEIWAPSAFARACIARISPIPVLCMPHAQALSHARPRRAEFGLANSDWVFICAFDGLSQLVRKNPLAVIAAFKAVFPLDDQERPVKLLIKTRNLKPLERAQLDAAIDNHPRISLIDAALDAATLQSLIASCDVLVSLHRAEGFGLLLSEAMALGVPVLASGWSGNLEFMDANNSILINTQPFELPADDGYFSAGTRWQEPVFADVVERMRWLAEHPERAREIGELGRLSIAKRLSFEAIGERMRKRVEDQAGHRLRPMGR